MKTIQLAIRTLLRFKLYTIINILGLALSLTCVIIISRYAYREITANHFIKNIDQLYFSTVQYEGNDKVSVSDIEDSYFEGFAVNPFKLPIIKAHTTFINLRNDNITLDKQTFNANIYATDPTFLQLLDYPLIQGNRETVLSNPEDAVITENFAKKIFGKDNPIGKTLKHSCGKLITITGIIGEVGTKSSFDFDLLISSDLQEYWLQSGNTIIQVTPGADINKLNKDLSPFVFKQMWTNKIRFQFVPLTDFYFDKKITFYNNPQAHGNYTNVIILLIVSCLILVIGLFNFINIYTVIMLKRGREFGIKKVFGSNTTQIITQLLVENLIMIGIALGIGWVFIEITRNLADKMLEIPPISSPAFDCVISLSILFILPIITSIYPFIRYNYSTPISSLKSINAEGNSTLSHTLFLSLQYIITFSLVVIAIFFIKQLNFMLNADLGYRTENIVKIQFQKRNSDNSQDWEKKEKNNSEIKHRMDESPLFTHWGYGESPNKFEQSSIRFKTPEGEYHNVCLKFLHPNYFDIYELSFKEGRFWKKTGEESNEYNLIINETAQKTFGITSIEDAWIQPDMRLVIRSAEDIVTPSPPCRVIGIIKDFKMSHLAQKTTPLIISYGTEQNTNELMAVIAKGKKQEAIAFLKKLYNETVGGEFEYTFLEDEIAEMYREDKRVANIYSVFALLAIIISSLGLFGLSLFDVQHRYREIALRKINGAQVKDIVFLLLRKYCILLSLSFMVAIPVSYIAIQKYLEDFANKAPLSWWIFAIAAIITTSISIGTLIFHTRKAANSNPASILKNE